MFFSTFWVFHLNLLVFFFLLGCHLFLFCSLFLVKDILHIGCCNVKQIRSYMERLLCGDYQFFSGQFLFHEVSKESYFVKIFYNTCFAFINTFKNYNEINLNIVSEFETKISKIRRVDTKIIKNGQKLYQYR